MQELRLITRNVTTEIINECYTNFHYYRQHQLNNCELQKNANFKQIVTLYVNGNKFNEENITAPNMLISWFVNMFLTEFPYISLNFPEFSTFFEKHLINKNSVFFTMAPTYYPACVLT